MKKPIENWKPIVGFEDYEVSNLGRVRRAVVSRNPAIQAGRVLKGTTTLKGYSQVEGTKSGLENTSDLGHQGRQRERGGTGVL